MKQQCLTFGPNFTTQSQNISPASQQLRAGGRGADHHHRREIGCPPHTQLETPASCYAPSDVICAWGSDSGACLPFVLRLASGNPTCPTFCHRLEVNSCVTRASACDSKGACPPPARCQARILFLQIPIPSAGLGRTLMRAFHATSAQLRMLPELVAVTKPSCSTGNEFGSRGPERQ